MSNKRNSSAFLRSSKRRCCCASSACKTFNSSSCACLYSTVSLIFSLSITVPSMGAPSTASVH
ncbi:hypothetical protein Hanom_Chr16g01505791 [Helianthus anomalus]